MYTNISDYLGYNKETFSTKKQISLIWKDSYVGTTADPKIWGPSLWLMLHISANYYPINPSPLVRERMKNRILAIPYELPCISCQSHASSFIESRSQELDIIVSTRDNLIKFYVDFHNKVNERYNKTKWTVEQAKDYYSGNVSIKYLS